MIFTPDNAQKVMAGQKTQTRRPEGERDEAEYDALGKIWRVVSHPNDIYSRERWRVGKIYAVQPGRTKKAIGYIRLISIRRERVNLISEADARAEGIILPPCNYPGRCNSSRCPHHRHDAYQFAFSCLWDSIYSGGMAFSTGPMVWVLEFELTTGDK